MLAFVVLVINKTICLLIDYHSTFECSTSKRMRTDQSVRDATPSDLPAFCAFVHEEAAWRPFHACS